METWKSPLMSSTTCYLFSNMHTKAKFKGGREDIQETCPKETSKGQWSTTKCISSICCIQQDVTNASFSLPLRGEQEKAALGENPLKCLQCCDCKNVVFWISIKSKKCKLCKSLKNVNTSQSQNHHRHHHHQQHNKRQMHIPLYFLKPDVGRKALVSER